MKTFQKQYPGEIIVRTAPDFLQRTFNQLRGNLKLTLEDGYDVSRVYLMLDEVLSNIYKHGYGRQDGQPIGVRVRVENGLCVIVTRDLAPTFDSPGQARTRVLPDPETGAPGGRGLVIVHRMCESFEHEAPPEGGNVLRLVLKLILRSGVLGAAPRRKRITRTQK